MRASAHGRAKQKRAPGWEGAHLGSVICPKEPNLMRSNTRLCSEKLKESFTSINKCWDNLQTAISPEISTAPPCTKHPPSCFDSKALLLFQCSPRYKKKSEILPQRCTQPRVDGAIQKLFATPCELMQTQSPPV